MQSLGLVLFHIRIELRACMREILMMQRVKQIWPYSSVAVTPSPHVPSLQTQALSVKISCAQVCWIGSRMMVFLLNTNRPVVVICVLVDCCIITLMEVIRTWVLDMLFTGGTFQIFGDVLEENHGCMFTVSCHDMIRVGPIASHTAVI